MKRKQPLEFSLPARILKAASYFQAKRDVRFYLNGIHIDPAGYIEATNGHVLIRFESEAATLLPKPLILNISGNIPTTAHHADFRFATNDAGLITFRDGIQKTIKNGTERTMIPFSVIDGKFPDTAKLLPAEPLQGVEEIGINAGYVGLIEKATKALGMSWPDGVFRFRGKTNAIEFVLSSREYKAIALIMPMRV